MYKRHIITLAILYFFTFNVYSQQNLRKQVAVVRPVYTENTKTFLTKFAKSLKEDGYTKLANFIKSYLKGGFGSGFVYANSKGETFVITNRHVVAHSNKADIEFVNPDQSVVLYSDCPITAIDERYDLAAIKLPQNVKKDFSFEIDSTKCSDGSTVFSAGYPGLENEPSWQLGKGVVSNNNFRTESLKNDLGSYSAILHTAQIDPGNSGGPLLRKDKDGNFKIVGVNTWKMWIGQSINIAISSELLLKFVNENLQNKKETTKSDLELRIKQYCSLSDSGYKDAVKYISYQYISDISYESFQRLIKEIPEETLKEIAGTMAQGHPMEAIRMIIAAAIYNRIKPDGLAFKNIENYISTNHPTKAKLKHKSKVISSTWIVEQTHWRLRNISIFDKINKPERGINKDFDFEESLSIGAFKPLGDRELTYWSISYIRCSLKFLTFNGNLFLGKQIKDANGKKLDKPNLYIGFNTGFGLQAPIKLSKMYLVPFFRIFYNIDAMVGRSGLTFNSGVESIIKLGHTTHLLLGIDWHKRTYTNIDSDDSYDPIVDFGIRCGLIY